MKKREGEKENEEERGEKESNFFFSFFILFLPVLRTSDTIDPEPEVDEKEDCSIP